MLNSNLFNSLIKFTGADPQYKTSLKVNINDVFVYHSDIVM